MGYVSLTVGVPLDLLGLLDMSEGSGLLLVVPGGLFELVFLPGWLITKGFAAPSATEEVGSAPATDQAPASGVKIASMDSSNTAAKVKASGRLGS